MLRPGSVVRDDERNSLLHGCQGEVVHVQNRLWGPPDVTVRFHSQVVSAQGACLPYMGPNRDPQFDSFWFYEEYSAPRLKRDKAWEPTALAAILWGRRFHSLYLLKDPFDPHKLCMHEGCPNACAQRILVNCWGVVSNADVCDEHARLHGWCMDAFPYRRQEAVA
ncbi:MAG: hypothetical protein WDZ79_01490 [Candidatus Paceibacterota bacterium]